MTGTGLLVLYRTTGVLNFVFGAVGAMGANITWHLIEKTEWCPDWLAYVACVVVVERRSRCSTAGPRAALRRTATRSARAAARWVSR